MDRIKVTSFNIRGCVSAEKQAEVQKFVDTHSPELLFLQETFLKHNNNLNIAGYRCIRADRPTFGGGIATLVKNNLSFDQVNYKFVLNCAEALTIQIKYKCGDQNYILLCTNIYIPKANRLLVRDLKNLWRFDNHFMAGDFNAIHPNWSGGSTNTAGKIVHDQILKNGYLLFATDEPTHAHPNGAHSTIDLLITNSSHYNNDLNICNDLTSDHLPIAFSFIGGLLQSPPKTIFDYERADWDSYADEFKNDDQFNGNLPLQLNDAADIDLALQLLSSKIKEAFNRAVPRKTVRSQESHLTAGTLLLIGKKTRC